MITSLVRQLPNYAELVGKTQWVAELPYGITGGIITIPLSCSRGWHHPTKERGCPQESPLCGPDVDLLRSCVLSRAEQCASRVALLDFPNGLSSCWELSWNTSTRFGTGRVRAGYLVRWLALQGLTGQDAYPLCRVACLTNDTHDFHYSGVVYWLG